MAPVILGILLVLVPLPLSAKAQTRGNLSVGFSVMANGRNSSLLSPSGEFAFGFRQLGRGAHLLAIWFEKIEDKTIVWSANGDNLAPEGSKVQLAVDGRLVLADPKGRELWSSNLTGSGVAYAAMLDTGNLIVANGTHIKLWDTFSHPTDTILPTQRLDLGSTVKARYTEVNYSAGRFIFPLQPDGNLVLYATPSPLAFSDAYWASNTVGSGFWLIFNQSGQVYLTARDGTILNKITSETVPSSGFYHRAILEYDGVFRQYVHPKLADSSWPMNWSLVSTPVPSNICTSIRRESGTGACGFNSYCTVGDDKYRRPRCQCPPGYTLLDSTNEMNGCTPDFVSQSCDASTPEKDQFILHDMLNTDWPVPDNDLGTPLNEDGCREACLADCFCAVAVYGYGNCSRKGIPLYNGRMDPSEGRKALIKVRKENSTSTSPGNGHNKKNNSTLVIVGSVLLSINMFVSLLLLLIIYSNRKSFQSGDSEFSRPVQINQATGMQTFSYQELQQATNGFEEELGRGGFGVVYKGVLGSENTKFVAVKVLATRSGESGNGERRNEGSERKDFEREVSTIGQTNHKNLVQLLGFCNEGQYRILVYEFMSNGSLADFLFGSSRPSWSQRTGIACGVARGLSYLHDDCNRPIIHCDIKPQNVLLDGFLTAKISDFGIAKLLMANQTRSTTEIRGTIGYLAPEWLRDMPISAKVDVYSFGILLLELICCRKNHKREAKTEAQVLLVKWVYDCYRDDSMLQIVESDEEASSDMRRVTRFAMTALWCIQEDPALRPTMKEISQMLEGALEVSAPPMPLVCDFACLDD